MASNHLQGASTGDDRGTMGDYAYQGPDPTQQYAPYPVQLGSGGGMQTGLPPVTQEFARYMPKAPSSYTGTLSDDSDSLRRRAKAHVASACVNCKKAHLACDAQRPCPRCVSIGKADQCFDVAHKRRGRPRRKDLTLSPTSTSASTDISAASSASRPYPSSASSLHSATRMSPVAKFSASPTTSNWGSGSLGGHAQDRSAGLEMSASWGAGYASSGYTAASTMLTSYPATSCAGSIAASTEAESCRRSASDSGWSPNSRPTLHNAPPPIPIQQLHEAPRQSQTDRNLPEWYPSNRHGAMPDPYQPPAPPGQLKLGLGSNMSAWMVARDLPPLKATALVGVWTTDLRLKILRAGCMLQDGTISSYLDPALVRKRPQEITPPQYAHLFDRLEQEVLDEVRQLGFQATSTGEEQTPYETTLCERLDSYGDDGFELLTRPLPGAYYRLFEAPLYDPFGRAVPCTISAIIGARSALCGPYIAWAIRFEDATGEISADATNQNNAYKAELRAREEAEIRARQKLAVAQSQLQSPRRSAADDGQIQNGGINNDKSPNRPQGVGHQDQQVTMPAIQEDAVMRGNANTARGTKLPSLLSLGLEMGRSNESDPERPY